MSKNKKKKKGLKKHHFIHENDKNVNQVLEKEEQKLENTDSPKFIDNHLKKDLKQFQIISATLFLIVVGFYLLSSETELLNPLLEKLGL